MKTSLKQMFFYLFGGILVFLINCNISTAVNSNGNSANGNSAFKTALDKAKGSGQAVFVVVTENGNSETGKAVAIAEKAKALYKNAVVVQMRREDTENAQLVNEWRLSGAPLPLILVVSPKGILTGGRILSQATAENIASLIPSPKKEAVLEQMTSGKSVFLLVSKKGMTKKSAQLSTCQKACLEMKENAKVIEIDLDDPLENTFLSELNISQNITEPLTYVINSSGQITGTFNGEANTAILVASAKKVITSSCCPAGSGQTCAPAK
jgi:hypothetical protein